MYSPGSALDDERWLRAWSRAAPLPEWQRVPALLAALGDDRADVDDADGWPIGAVAASALAVVAHACGGKVQAAATCRSCGEAMEIELPIAELIALGDSVVAQPRAFDVGGHHVELRPLAPRDLGAIAGRAGNANAAAGMLLARCLTAAEPALPTPVPAALVAAIETALEGLDPLAVVTLESTCPACGERDAPVLDVLDCVWTLFEARAHRLLDDVHRLARAYGWSERDILALGAVRRAAYLELVP